MSDDKIPLAELMAKADEGNFLRSVAENLLQILMESDAEGMTGAALYERSGERATYRQGSRDRTSARAWASCSSRPQATVAGISLASSSWGVLSRRRLSR